MTDLSSPSRSDQLRVTTSLLLNGFQRLLPRSESGDAAFTARYLIKHGHRLTSAFVNQRPDVRVLSGGWTDERTCVFVTVFRNKTLDTSRPHETYLRLKAEK